MDTERGTSLQGRGELRREWGVRMALLAVVIAALAIRLFSASFDPTAGRFHDERYALENVGEVLRTGQIRPTTGYHPSLSWLPQVAVLGPLYLIDETYFGGQHVLKERAPYRPGGGQPPVYPFQPLAYQVGRGLQASLGALAVLVTFLVGRRLWGEIEGLVAAALLACSPVAVRQSSLINEDAMLVLTTGLAVLWALGAHADPRRRSYQLAGVGIGLAAASKFNALPVILPLVVITLFVPRSVGRRIVLLGWAGLAAAVTFLVLNPFLVLDRGIYVRDFGRTLRDYDRKAAASDMTHLDVLVQPFAAIFDATLLGGLGGALALGGVAVLLFRSLGRRRPGEAALLSMVLGYPAVYAVATRNTNFTNWLPIVPFFCLAAGYLWGSLLSSPTPLRRRRPAALVAWTLGSLVALVPLLATTRAAALPTTAEVAGGFAHGRSESGVAIIQEPLDGTTIPNRHMAVVQVPNPTWLPTDSLRGADALVFLEERGSRRPMPPGLLDQPWVGGTRTLRPTLLSRRGPALTVVLVPWLHVDERWAEATADGSGYRLTARIADLDAPWISAEMTLPRGWSVPPSLLVNGRPVSLHWARSRGGRDTYVSLRVRQRPAQPIRLELRMPAGSPSTDSQWLLVKGWEPG